MFKRKFSIVALVAILVAGFTVVSNAKPANEKVVPGCYGSVTGTITPPPRGSGECDNLSSPVTISNPQNPGSCLQPYSNFCCYKVNASNQVTQICYGSFQAD